jgi:hypothetical protein
VSTLKTRNIREALNAKGFRESTRDHCYFFFYLKGKKSSVFTKVSHGSDEVGDNLISLMAKQVRLNKAQFQRLIECSLDADKYAEFLISSGYVVEASR